MGLGVGLTTLPCKKRKSLRNLQEIQPDFVEEAKKKKKKKKRAMTSPVLVNTVRCPVPR
jgi:hypothetical protein